MFKVPFYSFQNYQTIIGKHYDEQDVEERVDLESFVKLLTPEFVAKYAEVDARGLGNYLEYNNLSETIAFAGKFKSLEDVLVASKLLMPSLWTCDYFLWNWWSWTHTGIDILLPKGTPILSISWWKVVRIKERDGEKKDEWNCVVIQSWDYYFDYKHLDSIAVEYGQKISPSSVLWTCGNTGNSTQYHVHLQVDNEHASFQPYRSNQLWSIEKNTENPLPFLQHLFETFDLFYDMPEEVKYADAIRSLTQQKIIKWFEQKIFPEQNFPRWQAALIIDRVVNKFGLYSQMPIYAHSYSAYSDDPELIDPELPDTLKRLQKYGVMIGFQGKFFPERSLKWEERLAMLGRVFFRLEDAIEGQRFAPYVKYFETKNIIDAHWNFVWRALERQEVFLVLDSVLKLIANW